MTRATRRGFLVTLGLVAFAAPGALAQRNILVVVIDSAGHASIGGRPVDDAGVTAAAADLVRHAGAAARAEIVVAADTPYATVVHTMDLLLAGGLTAVSLDRDLPPAASS